MEKKFPIFKLLTLLVWLVLGMGTAFAACVTNSTNVVWDGSAKEEPCLVNGYYEINTAAKLAWYAKNYTKGNAKLTANIDLGGKLWTPIAAGTGEQKFAKIFDGDNHVIKNLYINGTELAAINSKYAQNLGFVGTLGGGTIKNLVLENVDIQATTNAGTILTNADQQISVGAFVGWMAEVNNNLVDNCMVTGTIKTTGNSQGVGGIVGNAKKGTISNCMSLVEIQTSGSKANIGGIIGITKTDVSISSCVYAGPGLINTGSGGSVGGITGNVWSGTMSAEDSYYEGTNYYQDSVVVGVGNACPKCSLHVEVVEHVDDVNSEEVICALNGIDSTTGACKTEPWSLGETGPSLSGYGIDGYKIVFDANGGVFANGKANKDKFLDAGMALTADEVGVPSRDNYKFIGWALTSDAAAPAANLGTVSHTDTIFAVWAPVYTVTFDVDPGEFPESGESVQTKQVASGDVITVEGLGALPTSRCKVYVSGTDGECETWSYFTGWALTAGAPESDSVSLDTMTASDGLVLHAVWTDVETYTVTYNANKHGTTTVDYVRVGAGDTVSAPTDPIANDGYKFAGWYTDADGVNPYQFAAQIHESIVLYAKWTLKRFDISYVMNNEDAVNGDNPSSYTIDTSFALKAPADIEGFVFEGWFYDAAFTNKATQVIQGTTGDKTFYGKWSKKTYRVMYLADNNSYGSITDQFVEHGTTINLESAGIFRRAGYDQNGWSATMGGAKTNELGESVTVVAPITLYPTWNLATYTITYECDGCVNDPKNPTTYTYNDQIGIKFAKAPEGYSFAGWFKEPDYTTQVTQIVKKSYGNITLYGKQLVLYKITYVGTEQARNDTLYTVESVVTFRDPAPREGYTFAGWYDNADFTGEPVTEIPLGSTGDKTFYAKWTPITYTITYVIDGEENAIEAGSFTVEGAVTLPTPTKDQYTFDGWYETEALTGDKVTGFDAGTYKTDKTFYAKWNKVYPFVAHYGPAITVTEYEGGTKTAVVNGNYGAHEDENEHGPGQAVEIPNDIPVNSVVMTRKFPKQAGEYSTIVLPFDVNTEKVSGVKAVLRYNGIKNSSTISMKVVWAADGVIQDAKGNDVHYGDSTLNANTPYMVLMDDERDGKFEVDGGVTLKQTTPANTEIDGCNWMFHGTWKYKEWGSACSTEEQGCDKETGNAYGFAASASEDNQINIGTFVKVGKGAWIRPMRAYLVHKDKLQTPEFARANGAYVKRPTVKPEELPEIMSVVIDGIGDGNETTVIGQFNTRTGVFKMNYDRGKFDLKGRRVNGSNNARGAYYGKKILKK